jgi:hypothetical protein
LKKDREREHCRLLHYHPLLEIRRALLAVLFSLGRKVRVFNSRLGKAVPHFLGRIFRRLSVHRGPAAALACIILLLLKFR